MIVDPGIIAAVVTAIISLIGLAAWVGALSQRVSTNRDNIDKFCQENREDHKGIFYKLDEINKYLRNGK